MYNGNGVSVKKIVDKMKLKVLNPEVDIKTRKVTTTEVNRPALQLAGYFDYFEKSRVEIVGMVEYTYMQKLEHDVKLDIYKKFFAHNVPCVIFSLALANAAFSHYQQALAIYIDQHAMNGDAGCKRFSQIINQLCHKF